MTTDAAPVCLSCGDKHAQRRDDDGGGARLSELFEIGRQPCREHDEYDADLAHHGEDEHHLVCKQEVLEGLPGDVFEEADEQHADDGGHADAVCAEAHELAQAQDERKGKQDFKCLHSVFSLCRRAGRPSAERAAFFPQLIIADFAQKASIWGGERKRFLRFFARLIAACGGRREAGKGCLKMARGNACQTRINMV